MKRNLRWFLVLLVIFFSGLTPLVFGGGCGDNCPSGGGGSSGVVGNGDNSQPPSTTDFSKYSCNSQFVCQNPDQNITIYKNSDGTTAYIVQSVRGSTASRSSKAIIWVFNLHDSVSNAAKTMGIVYESASGNFTPIAIKEIAGAVDLLFPNPFFKDLIYGNYLKIEDIYIPNKLNTSQYIAASNEGVNFKEYVLSNLKGHFNDSVNDLSVYGVPLGSYFATKGNSGRCDAGFGTDFPFPFSVKLSLRRPLSDKSNTFVSDYSGMTLREYAFQNPVFRNQIIACEEEQSAKKIAEVNNPTQVAPLSSLPSSISTANNFSTKKAVFAIKKSKPSPLSIVLNIVLNKVKTLLNHKKIEKFFGPYGSSNGEYTNRLLVINPSNSIVVTKIHNDLVYENKNNYFISLEADGKIFGFLISKSDFKLLKKSNDPVMPEVLSLIENTDTLPLTPKELLAHVVVKDGSANFNTLAIKRFGRLGQLSISAPKKIDVVFTFSADMNRFVRGCPNAKSGSGFFRPEKMTVTC